MSAYTTHLISRLDPLKYIFQKPMPTGKLAKWQILFTVFEIVYITQKAIKGQALADHLTKYLVDGDYKPLTTYFPDEEVLSAGEDIAESYPGWRMSFDRATNFKRVGIGVVLISVSGQHYPALAKIRFPCTNNMTEYEACILGIRMAVDMNIKELLVIGDSYLLIHQSRGMVHQECQDTLIHALCERAVQEVHKYRVQAHPRDSERVRRRPYEEPDGKLWYHNIKKFLTTKEYLEDSTNGQKRSLRSQEDLERGILLDGYGKRKYLLRAEVSPVPDSQGFHSGSTK
ncbi:uncharacterized protein [Nicotiana tomentosiformis]|uniref:uncharacterized protein n=1 Tax=Nicotiana tomentosiformis TaxID=4098 RepID=UPI00388CE4F2